jgi:hypothetical protein
MKNTNEFKTEMVGLFILLGIIVGALSAGFIMGAWMHAKIICAC